MKLIKKFLIVILVLGIYVIFDPIEADNLSGTGGVGSAGVGTTTGKSGSWNSFKNGFYIAVYDNNNNQKGNILTVKNSTKTDENDDLIEGWIVGKTNNKMKTDPTKLYKYLGIPYDDTSGNYTKLKEYITVNLAVNLEKGDYVIIEPFTEIGDKWNTFRSISANDKTDSYIDSKGKEVNHRFYNWYWRAAVLMANSAKVGADITVGGHEYTAPSKNCNEDMYKAKNKKKFCGWNGDKYIGYGLVIVKYENMYGDLQFTKKDKNTGKTISGAGFTLYSDSSCTKILKKEQFTNTKGVVNFSGLNPGKVYYKETSVPEGYKGDTNCRNVSITAGETSRKTVNNTPNPQTGNLAINIKIKGTNTLITSSNATFEIYSGTNCKGTLVSTVSTSMGMTTTELGEGIYSIKEKTAPSGYAKSNAACVKSNTSITAGKTTTEDIFYEPTCATELNNLGANPTKEQLFTLYKKYPNFRNLLNLTNPSCTVSNCKDNSLLLNCLDASTNISQFTQDNLACYNGEPLTDASGNYIGFCQISYKLTNNLGTNKFYGKSGRLLITQSENIITIFQKNDLGKIIEKIIESEYIATAFTSKVCYTLNQLNTENINALPQYNVYFGDNNNDNIADALPSEENYSPVAHSFTTNGLNMYTLNKTNRYTLNSLYLEKISGKYSSVKSNSTTSDAIYGILSRFDKTNGTLPFKINNNISDSCKYETKKEIITDGIDLEFRIIDTKEPFNRNTMSNWSDGEDNSKDNDKVKRYIKESVNSYGLDQYGNKANPIYKITLTPNDIKIIREDNKLHHYDDYLAEEVSYKGNNVIRNSFLYSLEKGNLNGKNLSNKLFNSKYPN